MTGLQGTVVVVVMAALAEVAMVVAAMAAAALVEATKAMVLEGGRIPFKSLLTIKVFEIMDFRPDFWLM